MQCYTTIFDCFEWLPGYGENDIVIHPRGKGCDRKKHGGCIIVGYRDIGVRYRGQDIKI